MLTTITYRATLNRNGRTTPDGLRTVVISIYQLGTRRRHRPHPGSPAPRDHPPLLHLRAPGGPLPGRRQPLRSPARGAREDNLSRGKETGIKNNCRQIFWLFRQECVPLQALRHCSVLCGRLLPPLTEPLQRSPQRHSLGTAVNDECIKIPQFNFFNQKVTFHSILLLYLCRTKYSLSREKTNNNILIINKTKGIMKKYLMMGAAALAISSAFVSCSKEKDLYDPTTNAEKFLQDYQQAFIRVFG